MRQLQEAKSEASLANKRLAEVLLQLHNNKELTSKQRTQQQDDDELEYSYSFEDEMSSSQLECVSSAEKLQQQPPQPQQRQQQQRQQETRAAPPLVSQSLSSLAGRYRITLFCYICISNVTTPELRSSLESLRNSSNVPLSSMAPDLKHVISNSQSLFQTQLQSLRERLSCANASYLTNLQSAVPLVAKVTALTAYVATLPQNHVTSPGSHRMG